MSLDDEVNVRSAFVSYERWGQTHLIFEMHLGTANKLSPDQYRRIQNLLEALNELEKVCPSNIPVGVDPSWTLRKIARH